MRGDVGNGRDLDAAADAELAQHGADDRMLDLIGARYVLGARIADPQPVVEFGVHGDVDIAVDRRADDGAAVATVEHRHIGPAAHEAHAQRSAADDHASPRAAIRRPFPSITPSRAVEPAADDQSHRSAKQNEDSLAWNAINAFASTR